MAEVVADVVEGVSRGEDRVVAQVEGKPGDRLAFNQPVSVAKALYLELKRLDEEGKFGEVGRG